MTPSSTPSQVFVTRRRTLLDRFTAPVLLASGSPRPRNYFGNTYPFRATSHFLYFVGAPISQAALLFAEGKTTLFMEPPTVDSALWMGVTETLDQVRETHRLDAVRALDELPAALARLGGGGSVATLPTQDADSSGWLSTLLGRPVLPSGGPKLAEGSLDARLGEALAGMRRIHDAGALSQLRAAAEASACAHLVGMRATRGASFEYEVLGAMVGELRRQHMGESYGPIVSTHGEILHNESHEHRLYPGDLLLADVGAETPEGWAGDITRTWPVSGRFSSTQREIYELVLAVQKQAVASVRKGVRYRSIHEKAGRTLVEGLVSLGIYKGSVDGLTERGAAGIFMPHGIGHLIGLDVHDLEDLGDRASYAPGRVRSTRFGDRSLRMDLDLVPGMAVTIEPGFYHVPAILSNKEILGTLEADLDREVLARYGDVRGIRIEDDVLCTDAEPEVMTALVPKEPDAVEAVVSGRG